MPAMFDFYYRAEKNTKKRLCRKTICLICLFPLIAETVPAKDEFYSFKEVNSLTICLPADIETLDPVNHRNRITQIVLKNIFDSLTTRDSGNRVIPQLAESWRLLNDTEWEFSLHRGVKFHNGEEFKASDAAFTLERIINDSYPGFPPSPRKGLFSAVSDVIVIDDYTLKIKTDYPWPNLPLMLSLQEIIPEKYMKSVGPEKFNKKPVGTGPFKIVHRNKNKEIILERFKGYYGGSPERPPVQAAPLKYLVFRVLPSYLDQIAFLKKKECNLLFNVPPELISVLKTSGEIVIHSIPATRCIFADINCSRPYFKDTLVRRALNYAVDVETIINQKLMGKGYALSTVFLPNAAGYNPGLKAHPYDPEIAWKLLIAAEFPLDHVILIYTDQNNLLFADGISLYLTKLGLKTRIKIVSDTKPETTGPNASWDIFVGSWGNSTLDPMGIVVPKLKSGGSANFSGFKSRELDIIIEETQKTMSESARIKNLHRIQEILFNETPMIFGYAPQEYYAVTKNVKNFVPSITGMLEMHDIFLGETGK
ncbi:MAG: ABC transporter substrate-binding protein [Desulfobacteraceae bacterium]|jgi:peptide/nickel transport system substrate-binding protein